MKTAAGIFAAVLMIAFTSAAQAVVPVEGTFRPAQCGHQTTVNEFDINIAKVCVGRVYGLNSESILNAVSFLMTDGTEKVYRVENVSRVLMATLNGEVQSVFHLVDEDGFGFSMNVVEGQEGEIKTVIGNANGWDFYVPHFEQMVTIQSF